MTEAMMSGPGPSKGAAESTIRPIQVGVPDEELDDLRRRVAAMRWPTRETVPDRSQGVPLATMQELARHWATNYDWRTVEARLQGHVPVPALSFG